MAIVRPTVNDPGAAAAGFTLIELMVAVVLGLLIIFAMFTAYTSASWTTSANARFAQVQNNGRYAIDFMRRDLQHAGYLGVQNTDLVSTYPSRLQKIGSIDSTNYGDCGAGFATRIEQPIWGIDNQNTLGCTDMAYARGDVLVLRRAGLNRLSGSPADNTLYVRTKFNYAAVFLGSALGSVPTGGTPEEDYPLEVDVYWVSPYTTSSTESPLVPALYRLTLGDGPAMTKQLIATGIENMQVEYGVASGGNTIFRNASAVDQSEWQSVVSVRIWLLARSTDPEPGYTNTNTYTMSNDTVTASDSFVRQVFPLVIGVRN